MVRQRAPRRAREATGRHSHGRSRQDTVKAFVPAPILVLAVLALLPGAGARRLRRTRAVDAPPPPKPSASPMTLKVMEFNIEYGGTQVSFAKVVEAVKTAHPDVIGLEEAETNTGRLAKAAGYPYWSNAMQVVSRYPLLEPPEAKGNYLYVQVRPGAASRSPTCTCRRRAGAARRSAAAQDGGAGGRDREAKVRLPYIQTQLQVLPPLAKQGIPVVPARRLQRALAPRLHGRRSSARATT